MAIPTPSPLPAPMTDSIPVPFYSHLLHGVKVVVAWLVGLSVLVITASAFTVLGYALFSTSTIPPGHALSVFYASLIGGSILVPPVYIACDAAFQSICPSGYRDLDMASILWMEYVPRALIIPVFVGGSALGLKILGLSSVFDEERLVDRGHLVAASALGGFIFQVIYEALRAGVVITTLIRERGERNSIR